jgi:hypothetical protein
MKHSEKPYQELSKANLAVTAMENAKSLDEFDEHWKRFLSHIERIWNKASNHFSKSPKWNGWKGKYEKLRKKDPLLAYFINARGADEHTVNDIVDREPGGIGINPAEENNLHIENMTINKGTISINSSQKLRIDFIPAKTKLLPITNRGRQYPVPKSHMGNPIDPANVVEIARIGAVFYESFLNEAEKYFVK